VAASKKLDVADSRVPPRICEGHGVPKGLGILALFALVAGAIVLFLFNPSQHAFYPFCIFYRTTGLLCPGCGSLRALHQLLHGNLAAALHLNALLVLCLPPAGWFAGDLVIRKLRNQAATLTVRTIWLWWGLAVLVAFGILRNLPCARLAGLAP
jgi:hypothetical protein